MAETLGNFVVSFLKIFIESIFILVVDYGDCISGDSDVTFFGNRPLAPEHRTVLIFEISCAQNFHTAAQICPKKRVFWHFSASQSTQ